MIIIMIILLNDNDNDGGLVVDHPLHSSRLLARIQPGVVHLQRQPRLGSPPSTIVRATQTMQYLFRSCANQASSSRRRFELLLQSAATASAAENDFCPQRPLQQKTIFAYWAASPAQGAALGYCGICFARHVQAHALSASTRSHSRRLFFLMIMTTMAAW